MKSAVNDIGLSARAHDKIIRVVPNPRRLGSNDQIQVHHLQEAIDFRILDRNMHTVVERFA